MAPALFRALLLLLHTVILVCADHYDTLGISRDATQEQVKKAYRRLALKHHPDKAKPQDKAASEKKFAAIAEAAEILGNEQKRHEYDHPPQQRQQPQGSPFTGGGGNGNTFFFHSRAQPSFDDAAFFRGKAPDLSDFMRGFASSGRSRHHTSGGFPDHQGGFDFNDFAQPPPAPSPPQSLYSSADAVVQLTSASFRAVTRAHRGDEVWIVHFYSSASHGCAALAGSLKSLSARLHGLVSIGGVDCDRHPDLCERQQIRTTPTVKLLSLSTHVDTITQQQKLSQTALTQVALAALPSHVVDVRRQKHINQFFQLCKTRGPKGCVLLFTEKYETAPLYKRLSSVYKGRLLFGEIRGKNPELSLLFRVQQYPSLMYFRGENAAPSIFNGKVAFAPVAAFLQRSTAHGASR